MDATYYVEKLYAIIYKWEKYKECLKVDKQENL